MYNRAYESARNELIPMAEAHADEVAGPAPRRCGKHPQGWVDEEWAAAWNLLFHTKMNELAKELL